MLQTHPEHNQYADDHQQNGAQRPLHAGKAVLVFQSCSLQQGVVFCTPARVDGFHLVLSLLGIQIAVRLIVISAQIFDRQSHDFVHLGVCFLHLGV
ncbi:hypothetical protein D3C80_1058980 [compost metagenome]